MPRFLVALVLLAVASPCDAGPTMCAIDMGSNTFRRIIGSFENGRYQQQNLEKTTVGVGDDVARHGMISDAKLAEINDVLSRYKASCQKEGASTVAAIGTAAFRDAPNGRRVIEMGSSLGIRMEITTEARESELAYLVGSLGQDGYAVVDNGSRSVELVSRNGATPSHHVFNLGYRVAYEKFFAAAADATAAISAFRDELKRHARQASFMKGRQKLVGVEFAEMAEVLFNTSAIEGRAFTLEELQHKLDQIVALPPHEFEALKKRKDIDRALPRLVVAAFMTEEFGYSRLDLTDRELGTGLIIEAGMKRP